MKKIPSKQYTEEFKREAVRLVLEQGLSASEVGRRLDVPNVSVRQPASFRAAASSTSLEVSPFSVCLGGSFLSRFAGLVHARLRGVAQSLECEGVLPGSGLVVCDLHGLASAAGA